MPLNLYDSRKFGDRGHAFIRNGRKEYTEDTERQREHREREDG
jgi:hypothetical protein